jgi:deazaflavin-dependent oxidoreductase (nitroreductase family)
VAASRQYTAQRAHKEITVTTAQPPLAASEPHLVRAFPRPETTLGRVIGDREYRAAFHSRLQVPNKFVVFFYRIGLLPLLGAAKNTMLLMTIGRKSLCPRWFPVGYFRLHGDIYMISGWGRGSNWYKNIRAHPQDLQIQIGLRRFSAEAHFVQDPSEVRQVVERLITESPAEAMRLLGWDPDADCLETADFWPILKNIIFVRFVRRT